MSGSLAVFSHFRNPQVSKVTIQVSGDRSLQQHQLSAWNGAHTLPLSTSNLKTAASQHQYQHAMWDPAGGFLEHHVASCFNRKSIYGKQFMYQHSQQCTGVETHKVSGVLLLGVKSKLQQFSLPIVQPKKRQFLCIHLYRLIAVQMDFNHLWTEEF